MNLTKLEAKMSPETEQKTYTCLLTFVRSGYSDSVLKVKPANGPEEKIWQTNTPGVERAAEVKRFLYQYARRGSRVPDPKPYHSDSSQLRSPDLKEEDIPVVELEPGVVFEVKLPEERRKTPNQPSLADELVNSKIATLEAKIKAMEAAADKPKVGRPKKVK